MNSGIYSALSGNIAAMKRLDVLTNNLANANTAGFKKDRLTFESILQAAGGQPPAGVQSDAPVYAETSFYTDYSTGPVKQSGNTFDLAIDGDGFFVINTPQGRAYTRQGNFHLDSTGKLVTADGYEVLGGGPITIAGGQVEVKGTGEIFVDGSQVGKLDVVDFPKPYAMQKMGSALFVPTNPQTTPQPVQGDRVRQGYLEESNVNAVEEMVQLIETNRYFEFCSKVVNTYDSMADKANNQIGKL
ncbi:flagellar basal-body rod protein FlgF [Geotalea uraniireducens]|uniref:Flagellar basal-body rod protein FlgF n=1 Tax=Geotalea uraniireducens TaxID=351604 RepID=A0ABN6VZX4_9BACT|nr:flagellar basal-body rod protein FlgF [Geotalea uraniireducens]BDV44445.1 flagellar basal-body rod protein FlgF [Geotalea uraniireducens]